MYDQISANKRRTFVLLFMFLLLVGALGWVISAALGQPDYLFIIGVVAIGYAAITYFSGSKMALAVHGAKEITKRDDPRLWRTVENLSITNGMPMPRVYIMDDPAPNAFATGRNPEKSAVCATTGLLQTMNDSELEGVMAHELGHIKNYDMRVNTIAFALVGVIALIGDFFWHISIFGGRDSGRSGNALTYGLAIAAIILAPLAATLIQLAISRRREYLADATGALTTRYPEGLANALEKIGKYGSALKKPNTSTAHMFLSNPLPANSLFSLFSTHPPVDQRVKILREMHL